MHKLSTYIARSQRDDGNDSSQNQTRKKKKKKKEKRGEANEDDLIPFADKSY